MNDHPDDLTLVAGIRHQLRAIREAAGLSRTTVAGRLRTTRDAVAQRENVASSPLIHTVQASARACDHRLRLVPHLSPALPDSPMAVALRAMAEGDPDPVMADLYHRSLILDTLTAHRRWMGISGRELATQMGVTRRTHKPSDVLSLMESDTKPPMLISYLRYARGLGGSMTVHFEPLTQLIEGAA